MTTQERDLKVKLLADILAKKGIHNRKQLQEALNSTEKIDISPFIPVRVNKRNVG